MRTLLLSLLFLPQILPAQSLTYGEGPLDKWTAPAPKSFPNACGVLYAPVPIIGRWKADGPKWADDPYLYPDIDFTPDTQIIGKDKSPVRYLVDGDEVWIFPDHQPSHYCFIAPTGKFGCAWEQGMEFYTRDK
jgi:hypothetical protein